METSGACQRYHGYERHRSALAEQTAGAALQQTDGMERVTAAERHQSVRLQQVTVPQRQTASRTVLCQ